MKINKRKFYTLGCPQFLIKPGANHTDRNKKMQNNKINNKKKFTKNYTNINTLLLFLIQIQQEYIKQYK